MTPAFESTHRACAALGTILFTVSALDTAAGLARRAYTSHPVEYPTSGTKPLTRDGWFDQCITGKQTFVANTAPEFARYFFDHALITSMGLGSCINIPIIDDAGTVLGTANLLAGEHHFTPATLAAYHRIIAENRPALVKALVNTLD